MLKMLRRHLLLHLLRRHLLGGGHS
jgi:hypothetical protein